jgi:hypothetical protein
MRLPYVSRIGKDGAHLSEKTVQSQIVHLLRSLGASVYVIGTVRRKGDWHGTMMSPGICDVLAFVQCRDAYRFVAIEVKAGRGRLRPEQAQFQAHCQAAHIEHVVGGLDAVIAWLEVHGCLITTIEPTQTTPAITRAETRHPRRHVT